MKLNGATLSIRETTTVTLNRKSVQGIELKICSIPLGLKRDYELVFPRPRPPVTTINRAGGKSEKEENYDDPNFVAAFEEWRYLQTIFTFYKVLEADTNIVWDNLPKDANSLRLLEREIKQSGFSDGDVAFILQEAAIASNISSRDLEEAKKGF